MQRLVSSFLITSLLVLSLPLVAVAQPEIPPFETVDCWFEAPENMVCGYVVVPEDRANPADGRQVRLAVAWLQVEGAQGDPLVLLAGGPGEKAVQNAATTASTLAQIFPNRDMILFDQRGVGLSEPGLLCQNDVGSVTREALLEVIPYEEQRQQATELAIQCGAELQAAGFNLAAYSTTADAADVNAVRLALGLEKIALYGVSYGTRTGLTVLRDYPDTVSAAVLDSVVPLQVDRTAETPLKIAAAFETFFATCAADAACNGAYPDLETVFNQLVETLNANPVTVTVNVKDLGRVEIPLTGDGLLGVAVQSLYFKNLYQQLPKLIFDATSGDYTLAASLTESALAVQDVVNFNKFVATECNSEVAFSNPAALEATYQQVPHLRPVTGVFGISGESIFEVCAAWGLSQPSPGDNDPSLSAVPTLLLSGEIDPVTPPDWARLAAEGLSQGYAFEFPGMGHSVLGQSSCALSMAIIFLNDPSQAPDASCIGQDAELSFLVPSTAQINLVSLTDEQYGFSTTVPEGWTEIQLNTFARAEDANDVAVLWINALPTTSFDTTMDQFFSALGLTYSENYELLTFNGLEWRVFRETVMGLSVMVAVTYHNEVAYIVLFQAEAGEFNELLQQVGLPAVQNFTLGQ